MAPSSPSSSPELDTALFLEPADYFPPPPSHTFTTYTLTSGLTLNLRLVGHNPLWGHHLWNAASSITTYLQHPPHTHRLLTRKSILELGAGAGLPSLAACHLGARSVLATDYPDPSLLENLAHNIHHSGLSPSLQKRITVAGHAFGASPELLLPNLSPDLASTPGCKGFDTLILADLLFNHTCHAALLRTVRATMARTRGARALVFFTPYRPWLLDRDMAFFEIAREGGMVVEEVGREMAGEVMFEGDRGDETLRRTIFQYELRWKDEELENADA